MEQHQRTWLMNSSSPRTSGLDQRRRHHCLSVVHGCQPSLITAAPTWNALLRHVTSAPSLPVFCSRLKTHHFGCSFSWLLLCLWSRDVFEHTTVEAKAKATILSSRCPRGRGQSSRTLSLLWSDFCCIYWILKSITWVTMTVELHCIDSAELSCRFSRRSSMIQRGNDCMGGLSVTSVTWSTKCKETTHEEPIIISLFNMSVDDKFD